MGDRDHSLLDQVILKHGPRDLLKRYFIQVDQWLCEQGLQVSICADFDRLAALNRRNRDCWPALMPFSDPAFNNFENDKAFWLDVRNEHDETVMTHSGRLFDWSHTTLAQEMRALRVLYSNPVPYVTAGDTIDIVDAPSASRIGGRVALTSAAWVRPDFRRRGLAKVVPRISRIYAYTRWRTRYTIFFIDPKLHALGMTRAYGDYRVEEGVVFSLKDRADVRGMLAWMTTGTLLRELERIVCLGQNGSVAQKRDAKSKSVALAAAPW